MRGMFSRVTWLVLCIGLTVLILWLSLLPPDSLPSSGLGWDKLNHAAAIAAVTLLAFLAFRPHGSAAGAALWYGLSLGALIEILQALFTTSRSAEWGDLLADLIGAGFIFCVLTLLKRRWTST